MPHVRHAVRDFFGQTPLTNIDPDKVVALGAAIQANLLAGNRALAVWLELDNSDWQLKEGMAATVTLED